MKAGVEKYILELLKMHDCVTVPGFGGFVLNRKPAHFMNGNQQLCPPARHLGFNRSLSHNDGLLQSAIAASEGISLYESLELIQASSSDWKNILQSEGSLSLYQIGSFQLSEEKKWNFEPYEEQTFMFSSYGLSNLQLVPLESKRQPRIESPVSRIKKARKGRRFWLTAVSTTTALAGIFILALLLGYQKIHEPKLKTQTASLLPLEEPKKDSPVTIINNLINDAKLAPEKAGLSHNMSFYVIGGSFSQKNNALKFAAALKNKGYAAEILDNETGFFRVAYFKEQDSIAADQHLQKIRIEENQGAWVLKW